ncbi:hypothetical protein L6452_15634 [Arctium lappa]|uniref:Uncharacterized protein n=1 Tax=Arctium lappa TaxID=4217 RepID=A0ACB9CPF6_ARCLA|nr:hypothetical protein L6452_15634 [Arctium lappa]
MLPAGEAPSPRAAHSTAAVRTMVKESLCLKPIGYVSRGSHVTMGVQKSVYELEVLEYWGVPCIGFLKRARQNKAISTQQAIKGLKDLERHRAELEARVIVNDA